MLLIRSPNYTTATACMVYVQWYSLYVRQGSDTAGKFEHRSSLTSDQNSLVSSHRSSLAIISHSMLNVSSLCAPPTPEIKSWLRHLVNSTFSFWHGFICYASHARPTYQLWLSYGNRLLSYELLNSITFSSALTITAHAQCHVTHRRWAKLVHVTHMQSVQSKM